MFLPLGFAECVVNYLFVARIVPGSLDGSQTDGSGKSGILDALGNGGADLGSHDAEITEGLQDGDDFNFILGVDLALVAEHFAQLGRELLDFGAGLAFLPVLVAVATDKSSQTEQGNGRAGGTLNQRL